MTPPCQRDLQSREGREEASSRTQIRFECLRRYQCHVFGIQIQCCETYETRIFCGISPKNNISVTFALECGGPNFRSLRILSTRQFFVALNANHRLNTNAPCIRCPFYCPPTRDSFQVVCVLWGATVWSGVHLNYLRLKSTNTTNPAPWFAGNE